MPERILYKNSYSKHSTVPHYGILEYNILDKILKTQKNFKLGIAQFTLDGRVLHVVLFTLEALIVYTIRRIYAKYFCVYCN